MAKRKTQNYKTLQKIEADSNYKAIRRGAGISQVELARIAGVSERTVRRFEKGESYNASLATEYARLIVAQKGALAREKYNRLEDYVNAHGYAETEGMKYFKNAGAYGGKMNKTVVGIGGFSGTDPSGLKTMADIKALDKKLTFFLEDSDVSDLEALYNKRYERAKNKIESIVADSETAQSNPDIITQERSKETYSEYFTLFTEIKNQNKHWKEYIQHETGNYDKASDQLLAEITNLLLLNMTHDEIKKYFQEEINTYIESRNVKDTDKFKKNLN